MECGVMKCIFTLSKIWKKDIFCVFVYFLCDRWVEMTRWHSQNFLIAICCTIGLLAQKESDSNSLFRPKLHQFTAFGGLLRFLTTCTVLWSIFIVDGSFYVLKQSNQIKSQLTSTVHNNITTHCLLFSTFQYELLVMSIVAQSSNQSLQCECECIVVLMHDVSGGEGD